MLPAGFEIETVRQGDGNTSGGLAWTGPLSIVRWLKARDARLDAIVELSHVVPTLRLAYVVRAVTPGHYAAPGARITDLDRPGRFARGGGGWVSVK